MKLSVVLAAVACTGGLLGLPAGAQASEALAKNYNCLSCHTVNKKVVGPAFKDIAAKYKGKGMEAALVEKVRKGGSGAWGSFPMPGNPQVSDADAKALVKWILSL